MTPDDAPTAAAPLDRIAWPVRTERLLLRRMSPADAPAMWAYRRLDEVTRWVTSRPVDEAAWIGGSGAMLRDQLVLELDGRVVGDVMVRVEDACAQREVAHLAVGTQAELGWTLDPAVGGRGLATEAVRAAVRIAFEGLGVRRVVASAFADNAPSLRLAERVGMRRESYAAADSLHRDLGWIDGVGYAMLAEERTARG
ncbi:GNAT family N-acetyltransferase [Clavibacter nebraskensis]|uniref:GNAT family N-acetyltransferase n=1 Tax=Clavibacter nebraskensis TaxID=31963 RepID=UPI00200EE476|nr:GNAT family N-acetyltransferase [Clavibacter nebraskensis]UQB14161.1 GNAT family N-acetyltransferase [Clavibacter nebraskensis]UQB16993.1 GNAT family N-acetyltransferase [Clavibacter nebraskensis]